MRAKGTEADRWLIGWGAPGASSLDLVMSRMFGVHPLRLGVVVIFKTVTSLGCTMLVSP